MKFIIKLPSPIDIPQIEDLSTGGFSKLSKCPECEEGILKFIGCDDENNITEILYECNVCHMPHVVKFKGESDGNDRK